MAREYEFIYISNPDIPEKPKHFEKYESLLTGRGQLIEKKDWGVKKMSYPIKKQFRGHYLYYNVATDPATIAEIERLMRIDDNVLRYMAIKLNDEVDVEARKQELAKAATTQG